MGENVANHKNASPHHVLKPSMSVYLYYGYAPLHSLLGEVVRTVVDVSDEVIDVGAES